MKLAVEIRSEHADGHVSPTGETFRGLSPRNTFRASTRRRQQQQDKHHLTVPSDHPDDMHTPSEDSGVDLPNGTIFGHGSRKGSRVSTGSRDSMSLDTKALQRKLSPSKPLADQPASRHAQISGRHDQFEGRQPGYQDEKNHFQEAQQRWGGWTF
ncbi:hypothetical protein CEXT_362841 [Caerostris extrusa]|uniref:Uncharacterized protein n=1 Tax=Caerostris extrusa TaxID=172846 RepID=A0AAV4P9T1_CAEEX|nr:hypothetical protein CEXT_362841 [Caerostris extrusa]